ncbi:MAG: hypothetical protein WBQ79_03540 [Acidobacteriaceae bacterium]
MQLKWIRVVFAIAALYEVVLGIVFLFFGSVVFRQTGTTPPNHMGYIQFPALLLVLFGVMFWRVAVDPIRNRDLVLYGAGLKAAYSGLAFWYEVNGGIPPLWLPWAWIDLIFLFLFLFAWTRIPTRN